MRREYHFRKGRPWRKTRLGRRVLAAVERGDADLEPVSATLQRTLDRRVADYENATRYLLRSRMTPRFVLYYNVSEDVYHLNQPEGATLFKRRKSAIAIKKLLSPRITVVRCTTRLKAGRRTPVLKTQGRSGSAVRRKGRPTTG